MNKDKLMQAAGRMRQLDKGQMIRFLATEDVTQQLRRVSSAGTAGAITSVHVLQWAMANTVSACLEGMGEYAKQVCSVLSALL